MEQSYKYKVLIATPTSIAFYIEPTATTESCKYKTPLRIAGGFCIYSLISRALINHQSDMTRGMAFGATRSGGRGFTYFSSSFFL